MIIDRDVQVLPPNAVVEIHIARAAGDPVAHPGDPAEFLGVEVQQIPGVRVLVPLHQGRRLQPPPPGQAAAPQHAGGGGRAHADGSTDLRARPALVAELLIPS